MSDLREDNVGPTERERIARIIDPEAWAELDAKRAGVQMASSFYALERVCAPSLTKADAILASDDGREMVRACIRALKPFAEIEVPSLTDAEGEEGDIPDFAELEITVPDYHVSLSDYAAPDDALTIADLYAARAIHAKAKEWLG